MERSQSAGQLPEDTELATSCSACTELSSTPISWGSSGMARYSGSPQTYTVPSGLLCSVQYQPSRQCDGFTQEHLLGLALQTWIVQSGLQCSIAVSQTDMLKAPCRATINSIWPVDSQTVLLVCRAVLHGVTQVGSMRASRESPKAASALQPCQPCSTANQDLDTVNQAGCASSKALDACISRGGAYCAEKHAGLRRQIIEQAKRWTKLTSPQGSIAHHRASPRTLAD